MPRPLDRRHSQAICQERHSRHRTGSHDDALLVVGFFLRYLRPIPGSGLSQGRMTRIPRRPLQHRDIQPRLAQTQPKLRSIIERNAQQHTLTRKNRNLTTIHRIVVRSNRLGIPQHQIKLRRPRQRFPILLRTLLRLRKKQAWLFFRVFSRRVIKLNPSMPPLRTNLANLLQKRLNLVVLLPEAREAVPLIDIDTRKKIGNIHHGCCAALGQHLRKSFSANEIAGQAVCQIPAISVVTHVRRDGGA
jgi:hypothetical protein